MENGGIYVDGLNAWIKELKPWSIIKHDLLSRSFHLCVIIANVKAMSQTGSEIKWGGASQLGFVHASHEFLQFDGECHVTLDFQLP